MCKGFRQQQRDIENVLDQDYSDQPENSARQFMSRAADEPMAAPTIERHRTAITRTDLSRPVRLALEDGLITPRDERL